jgi:hypothetical protein
MGPVLPYLILAAALGLLLSGLTWVGSWARRNGRMGSGLSGALASYEEAMRTTSHAAHHELRAQADRILQAPSPDPRWTRPGGNGGPVPPPRKGLRRGPRRSLRNRFAQRRRTV